MALFCCTFSRLDYTDKETKTSFRKNRYGLKTDGRLGLTLNLLGRSRLTVKESQADS